MTYTVYFLVSLMLTLVPIPFFHYLKQFVTLVHQPPAKATPEDVDYDSDDSEMMPPLISRRELYPDSSDSESDSDDEDQEPYGGCPPTRPFVRRKLKKRQCEKKQPPNYYEEGQEDNPTDADVLIQDALLDLNDSDLDLSDDQLNAVAKGNHETPILKRKPTHQQVVDLESQLDGDLSMLT